MEKGNNKTNESWYGYTDNRGKPQASLLVKILIVVFLGGIPWAIVISNSPGADECDCLDYMMALNPSVDNETLYLNCLDKFYDDAFDYMEMHEPNANFHDYEDVITHYWVVKCL
jgi:hypothetical protein|tara:strand:+ start:65 stop:406 length:342 start_codon:yes stop_codon:yes gene_type:complete